MGRRTLPKIDATLDLSGNLTSWDDLPRPWDARHLFGREARLEVEVGSGKGLFLQTSAESSPERDFLGIEISARYARFTAGRLAKRSLANAVVIHGDAQRIFGELLPEKSLAAVHVYFPDPWWKARHHKRRVMNAQFICNVATALADGGRLHFWTDVRERFEATLELIAAEARLAGPLEVTERAAQYALDYRTHFERRTRLSQLPVYRAEFHKR